MSTEISKKSDNSASHLLPETQEWLQQVSTPYRAIEELIAKIALLEEQLEISQEQVQTLKQELDNEQQKVKSYQEELEACHQEMAALNEELLDYYQSPILPENL